MQQQVGVNIQQYLDALHEIEKRHILAMLEHYRNNRTQAAKLLDISVRTLRNKLSEYGASAAEAASTPDGSDPGDDGRPLRTGNAA